MHQLSAQHSPANEKKEGMVLSRYNLILVLSGVGVGRGVTQMITGSKKNAQH